MRLVISIILLLGFSASLGAQNLMVQPDYNKDQNIFKLTLYNDYPCPLSVTVKSAELDTTFEVLLRNKEERILFTLHNPPHKLVANPQEVLTYRYYIGNPDAVHDDSYEYELPYPVDKSYRLTQGNKSNYTHNQAISEYAFDFGMPEGSFVAAARGGTVGYVEDSFKIGGIDNKLMDKSNQILVCHDDGTVAMYAHLTQNGALVEVGDIVYAGQVIGLSGNTGYSTNPHLHFVVLKGKQSIPIRFRNQYTILYEGEMYEHEE